MKKFAPILGIWILLASGVPASAQAGAEEKLLQDAKLLVMDGQWTQALEKLDDLLKRNPSGPAAGQACYYRAKCLNKLPGRERETIEAFKAYLQLKDRNPNLRDEAESAIIDLALKLSDKGDREYLKELEDRMASPNKAIRFYAAYQLSFAKDKTAAAKSVPVLKGFVASEKDSELGDRARIALLRIAPNELKNVEDSKSADRNVKMLVIEITKPGARKPDVLIRVPWALADLVMGSIPEEQKETMRRKGYDLNRLADQLTSIKGNIIEINGEDGTIKIYIDWIK